MTKYVIFFYESSLVKVYIETIYRNGVSTDKDVGDAIEFEDKVTALRVADYLNKRENNNREYKVMSIITTFEEITE